MKSLSLPENQGSVKLQLSCHRQWVSEDYQHPPLQRQYRVQSTTRKANSFDLTCDLERAPMDQTLQSQGMLHVDCVTHNNSWLNCKHGHFKLGYLISMLHLSKALSSTDYGMCT